MFGILHLASCILYSYLTQRFLFKFLMLLIFPRLNHHLKKNNGNMTNLIHRLICHERGQALELGIQHPPNKLVGVSVLRVGYHFQIVSAV